MIVENGSPIEVQVCLHCKTRRRARAGGLCHGCYFTPAIRMMYPPTEHPKHYSSPVGQKAPTRLPTPTSARPGTEEKVRVLAQRAGSGEQLWHPLDAVGDMESLDLGVPLHNS
jgi:small neutral amino acid transporter SnatA (MarC family)